MPKCCSGTLHKYLHDGTLFSDLSLFSHLTVSPKCSPSSEQQPAWQLALQAAQTTAAEVGFALTATWKAAGAHLGQAEAAWGCLEVQVLEESPNRATPTPPRWQRGSPAPPLSAPWMRSSWRTWRWWGGCWPAPEPTSTSSLRSSDRWGRSHYFREWGRHVCSFRLYFSNIWFDVLRLSFLSIYRHFFFPCVKLQRCVKWSVFTRSGSPWRTGQSLWRSQRKDPIPQPAAWTQALSMETRMMRWGMTWSQ